MPLRWASVPFAVKLALGCLAAYTALSYLSILWAAAPGEAWEGANRTLLYLFVFALFALWPGRGASAALLVGLWTFAMIALAVYVALRLDTATGKSYAALFSGERLSYPAGYPNATAAQWLMAFWPALLLARGKELHWAVRGLLAGGAVVLADVALLSLSRGSLYATPVMVVLVFAFIPDRLRTFATTVPVALGIGASAPFVVRVGNRIEARPCSIWNDAYRGRRDACRGCASRCGGGLWRRLRGSPCPLSGRGPRCAAGPWCHGLGHAARSGRRGSCRRGQSGHEGPP